MKRSTRKTVQKPFTTLRAALEAQDMTQVQLARLIGKDEPYVSNLLRGKFRPSLTMADRIQRVLNVDLAAMLRG